jgi:tetraprenyl-beta-curcumene synthase
MARANARFWPSVAPRVHRGLRRWKEAARAIPDARLREIALEKLEEEGFNTEVAATLAPRRHRAAAIDAIVPLQVMYDYLDGLSEEPAGDPLTNSRQLFTAFTDALTPGETGPVDYFAYAPGCEDGGYLEALVAACRQAVASLPGASVVAPVARAAAQRCGESQTRTHAIDALGLEQLSEWASEEARGTDLTWWEYTAGGTASILCVHALIAAAADPFVTSVEVESLDRAYLYISAISTLLDSVVDYQSDLEEEGHSFIAYYEDEQRAGEGVGKVIARAAAEARALRHGAHHQMTAAGVAAYYLSAPTASGPPGPAIKQRAVAELGPLLAAALGVFRFWRIGKTVRRRLRPPRGALSVSALLIAAVLVSSPCDRATAQPSAEPFEIVPGSFEATPSRTDAGAHADLSIAGELAHDEEGHTFGDLRSAAIDLPSGFLGNPQAVAVCSQADFLAGETTPACSPATQVGTIGFAGRLAASAVSARLPLYKLAPTETGVPAEIGFRLFAFTQVMPLTIRPDGGLTASIDGVSANVEPHNFSIEIWGVPAAAEHDPERGRWCLGLGGELNCNGGGVPAEAPPQPFLANPTRCGPAQPSRSGPSPGRIRAPGRAPTPKPARSVIAEGSRSSRG